MAAPEGATLSPDGLYWWDGADWQPVDGSPNHTPAAPATQYSDDGSFYLGEDGEWKEVAPSPADPTLVIVGGEHHDANQSVDPDQGGQCSYTEIWVHDGFGYTPEPEYWVPTGETRTYPEMVDLYFKYESLGQEAVGDVITAVQYAKWVANPVAGGALAQNAALRFMQLSGVAVFGAVVATIYLTVTHTTCGVVCPSCWRADHTDDEWTAYGSNDVPMAYTCQELEHPAHSHRCATDHHWDDVPIGVATQHKYEV